MDRVDRYLPSLSTDGWLESKEAIMEKLFIYFLAGDVYQSNTFKDQIYTLKEILQKSKNESYLVENITRYLQSLYSPYFPIVEPLVTSEVFEENNEIRYNIDVKTIDDQGRQYMLNRIIQMQGSNILNYQELLSNYKILKK